MSRRILFVVEGKKAEPRFLKKILRCYDVAEERQIHSVSTNIHVIYNRLFADGEEDELDLLNVLKEGASEEDRCILSMQYFDIYLIFDAEVHDPKWNPDNIKRMLDHFNNPTENGMLLLNGCVRPFG